MASTPMPTAGRMTAAAAFAALAASVSLLAVPLLPGVLSLTYLPWWNALIGAVCGYRIVRRERGDGRGAAIARGLTAGAATAFWALLLHSTARMIDLALDRRYDGIVDGIINTFGLMAGYARDVAAPEVIVPAIVGSGLAGLIADAMQRRFT